MNLASILKTEQIVPSMRATEHWAAIEELVCHLDNQKLLQGENREAVLDALRNREEKTSTGIGHGIAIPHVFSEKVYEVITVFGRSEIGIDFDAIDNAPVKLIVLFIVPQDKYQLHLRTLAAIAKMLNNVDIRKSLNEAESPEDILKVFSQRGTRS